MARSLSGVKLLITSSLVDGLSSPVCRRGYAAAAREAVVVSFGTGRTRNGVVGRVDQRAANESSGAWAPDPITGYYRPANRAAEIDPAELREMLLSQRVRPH